MEQAAPRSASFPRSSAFSRSADRLRFRLPRSLDQPPEQFPNDVLGRHSPRFRAHRLGRLSKRLARDLRGLSTHREDVIAEKERTVQAEGKGGLDFAQPIERHHRRRFARGLSISRSQPRLTSSRSFAPASNDLNPRASPAVRWLMCVSLKAARISSAGVRRGSTTRGVTGLELGSAPRPKLPNESRAQVHTLAGRGEPGAIAAPGPFSRGLRSATV